MSSKVKEDIQRVISDDSSKKTNGIMKALDLATLQPKPVHLQQMQTVLEKRGS